MTETGAANGASDEGGGRVALAVSQLSVSYGNVVAVHDATFRVAEGDACAITFCTIFRAQSAA